MKKAKGKTTDSLFRVGGLARFYLPGACTNVEFDKASDVALSL
jgi:hypothetical protein